MLHKGEGVQMLTSLILHLKAKNSGALPAITGRLVHAAFLKMVRSCEPQLSEHLHQGREERPFTLSAPQGPLDTESGHGTLKIHEQQAYRVRVTSLDRRLSELLLEWAQGGSRSRSLPRSFPLSHVDFTIASIARSRGEHPEARTTRWNDLYDRWISREQRATHAAREIVLRFASPTAFRRLAGSRARSFERTAPLPLPGMIWHSLVERWRRYAPDELKLRYRSEEVYDRWISVKRFKIRTHSLRFQDEQAFAQIGFTGVCAFLVHDQAAERLVQEANLLAEFAFYAGVGYKTSWGMGQVHQLRPFSSSSRLPREET